jgi:chaperone LolA
MKKTGLFFLLLLTSMVYADAMTQFKKFATNYKTMRAEFTQIVVTKNKSENATGILEISRPNKFRWTYKTPYKQIIIGLNKTLWIYDMELSQVTKKSMDSIMSPAYEILLSGSNHIEKNYKLSNDGNINNLEWLLATAKSITNIFRSVRMGFRNNMLVEMELTDRFNQKIILQFTHMQKNIRIASKRFIMTYPKNVNVLPEDL